MTRLRVAGWVFLAALLWLPVIGFIHELIVFGYWWGFLAGERFSVGGYPTLMGMLFVQLIGGAVYGAVLGVLGAVFCGSRICVWLLGICFTVIYLVSGNGTATLYQVEFGATWQFPEPFLELWFHPLLTPALGALGLVAFLWLTRRVWQVSR